MLDNFFNPKSVAIVGASSNPSKLGYCVVENLVNSGFTEKNTVYPVNPKGGEILGLQAYKSVSEIPGKVDLAELVIPAKFVAETVRECGEKGITSVIIITAGFREAGHEGVEREKEVMKIAREYGIRIIGPNVLGVLDTYSRLNASFSAGMPPQGPVNFMSQSGALGTAVLDFSMAGEIGFSKFVSLGNKADVSEIDLLEVWGDDDNANVNLAYIEGVPDGQRFIEAARISSKKKPIVAVKSGVTQAGSRAVSSHTGSLAGSEQAYAAAFKQAGIIRANTMEDMFDIARAFAYQPMLKGDRIAIITNAGGPGILATDALERNGLIVARLEKETTEQLIAVLPPAAATGNPVDVLGDAESDRYKIAIDIVSKDPNVDGILVVLTPQAMTDITGTAEAIADLSDRIDRPVLTSFMGAMAVLPGIDLMTKRGVPNYPFPERAVTALKAMSDYRKLAAKPLPEFKQIDVDKDAVKKVFEKVRADGRASIGDFEARDIMKAYGLPMPKAELAESADQAVELAEKYGFPIVMKIASPDILHKTDVGGVKVGLKTVEEVRETFETMVQQAEKYVPGARIWGCLVQEMAPQGHEILVGMNRDPQFGPLVTFALGGIYVEVLKDATFRIAPFSEEEAYEMLGEIRSHALLDGVRGKPPADKAAIVDTLLRINQLVLDFPEIVELDINPLMVYDEGNGAVAIDMRLVLKG
ncbi:MAG: acetate--CoA ligase family protein [Anaerolineae bacterium]|nr:acetate--CoA ligase family protein [Anaerolineae bacterium]